MKGLCSNRSSATKVPSEEFPPSPVTHQFPTQKLRFLRWSFVVRSHHSCQKTCEVGVEDTGSVTHFRVTNWRLIKRPCCVRKIITPPHCGAWRSTYYTLTTERAITTTASRKGLLNPTTCLTERGVWLFPGGDRESQKVVKSVKANLTEPGQKLPDLS